jgi:hypothetical protein
MRSRGRGEEKVEGERRGEEKVEGERRGEEKVEGERRKWKGKKRISGTPGAVSLRMV